MGGFIIRIITTPPYITRLRYKQNALKWNGTVYGYNSLNFWYTKKSSQLFLLQMN